MAGIFKAYDIRGIYPDEIDEAIARKIGLAFRSILDDAQGDGGTVVVSRDMRSHGVPLSEALIQGLLRSGLDVVDIGLATTPMSYFAVGHLGADGGIQVTASHNPARYNGFKLSLREARPVSGAHGIPILEERVLSGDLPEAGRPGELRAADVWEDYRRHVLAHLRRPEGARRLRVAVDCANGMGALYRPILEETGIELIPLYCELDGTFPNHEANPLKLENLRDLAAAVREHRADLGVAFDGDADRAAFVDERGEPVGSDLTTALIAGELLERNPGAAVIYDLRSSRAVAEHVRERGGVPVRERVGHSFMKATLREKDGIFGGELAGHYYFRESFYADSAILAVLELLNLLWKEDRPLSALVAPLARYAKTPEINFEVEDKEGMIRELARRYADAEIDTLDGITISYPTWWANVRPSNTEPLLRLVLEADTEEEMARRREELVALLGEPV
ncbi:MAG TPA: phosphomannomutase/phosphoglucomutase [Thermoanaerobaculia bacterium]|nr:phosphomannomutase/phosphoglucomutase [Thermoanaerobaculia bacterium]